MREASCPSGFNSADLERQRDRHPKQAPMSTE
jgi:hypothetical protein